ncbi:L,D-transpeptidase [Streptomyces lonarensis]|uniref:L,D-transpeptidase n=1 Tax=Streptomyces lonarensis TaxID=700599 RepID=A0A7X6D3B4_9ACTN|nr:L,D-transpeptidase [Streptomyces lonarensis]NJQ07362.1 L,D-transpeptidase [Streptomyces lonarensis]
MARGSSETHASPGAFVSVLTVVALAVVGFFAYQASAAQDSDPSAAPPGVEQPAGGQEGEHSPGEEPGGDATEGAEDEPEPNGEAGGEEHPLPPESGEGKRVVYGLSEQRVWLVDPADDGLGDEVTTTYPVHRSSVDPDPGSYLVSARTERITGSDGVPIENVIGFDAPGAVVFGFSTATDGSTPDPDSTTPTGGIRQFATDGEAMWEFTEVGTPVVVVP